MFIIKNTSLFYREQKKEIKNVNKKSIWNLVNLFFQIKKLPFKNMDSKTVIVSRDAKSSKTYFI